MKDVEFHKPASPDEKFSNIKLVVTSLEEFASKVSRQIPMDTNEVKVFCEVDEDPYVITLTKLKKI